LGIDSIKQIVDFVSNKYQNGYLSGAEFNLLWAQAENNYYSFLLGPVEQYQPGRPVPRVGLGMSETILAKLQPFIAKNHSATVTSGQLPVPADFERILAIRTMSDGEIVYVEHDRKPAALRDKIDPVTTSAPIYTPYATYWEINPSTVTTVKLDYMKTLPETKWNWSDGSGREIYNPTGSVDPLWRPTEIISIVGRLFLMLGISIKDSELIQYSNKIINTGE
jgi:hypothetical protein